MVITMRRGVAIAALVVVTAFGLIAPFWKNAADRGGQQEAEPFRIANNFYFVGTSDVSVFLITGPAGHILIDGDHPGTPGLIMASIAKLGFDIKDVKILINSEPQFEHAGGLGALQAASGAEMWASDASAVVLQSGGDDPALPLPLHALMWAGVISYPKVRVDHVLKDGDTIHLGPTALTAHITAGRSRGCTSWTWHVKEDDRILNVVSACDLTRMEFGGYPGEVADLERSVQTLRSFPADIWVTSHGRAWERYRKFAASQAAAHPVDAFIDPEGYRSYLDNALAALHRDRTP